MIYWFNGHKVVLIGEFKEFEGFLSLTTTPLSHIWNLLIQAPPIFLESVPLRMICLGVEGPLASFIQVLEYRPSQSI